MSPATGSILLACWSRLVGLLFFTLRDLPRPELLQQTRRGRWGGGGPGGGGWGLGGGPLWQAEVPPGHALFAPGPLSGGGWVPISGQKVQITGRKPVHGVLRPKASADWFW